MLSAVLHSDTAVDISIRIMNAFVAMRHFLLSNAQVFQRLDRMELKQLETDHNSAKLCSSIKTDEMLRTNTPFERPFASHSLLIPWQTSPYALYKGVLCYPPPSKGGRIRASPEQRGE